ncbi:MAG: hypothetical protein MJE66_05850 [Proteobacteria bacterium]|nr:hypothetical protein [Pseudomonadota bacterium]
MQGDLLAGRVWTCAAVALVLVGGTTRIATASGSPGPEYSDISLALVRPGSTDASVETAEDGLVVLAPGARWAYAAVLGLDDFLGSRGDFTLALEVSVEAGEFGIVVVDREKNRIHREVVVKAPMSDRIELTGKAQSVDALVIRTRVEPPVRSRLRLRSLAISPPPDPGRRGKRVRIPESPDIADYWLTETMRASVPSLSRSDTGDWEKVNAIRDWAYGQIPRAEPDTLLETIYPDRRSLGAAAELYLNREGVGGHYCGGTAQLLAKLYHRVGLEAYTYDMGTTEGNLSHVVTLVRIDHEGQPLVVVQDAYLNFTLTVGEKPLGFRHLIELLADDRLEEISVRRGNSDCKLVLVDRHRAEGVHHYHTGLYRTGPIRARGDRAVFCHDFNFATLDTRESYDEAAERLVGRRGLLYLFLAPLGTSGEDEVVALARQAREARSRLSASPVGTSTPP